MSDVLRGVEGDPLGRLAADAVGEDRAEREGHGGRCGAVTDEQREGEGVGRGDLALGGAQHDLERGQLGDDRAGHQQHQQLGALGVEKVETAGGDQDDQTADAADDDGGDIAGERLLEHGREFLSGTGGVGVAGRAGCPGQPSPGTRASTTCGRASPGARDGKKPSCLVPLDAGAKSLDHNGQESEDREHPIHTCLHTSSFAHGKRRPWCLPHVRLIGSHESAKERDWTYVRCPGRMEPLKARSGRRRYRAYVDRRRPAALHPVGAADGRTAVAARGARVPPRMARRGRARGPGADHLDPARRRRGPRRADPPRELPAARRLPRGQPPHPRACS